MVVFVKGDVVILPFPFSNLRGSKSRPALVIAIPKADEVMVCQITSQDSRKEFAIELNASDFSQGGLRKPSFIRPNQVFMIEPSVIKYCAAKIKPQKTKEVKDKKRSVNGANRPASQLEFESFPPKKAKAPSDYEEIYLNLLLEKIRTSDGLPSEAVMQEVSRLIGKINDKSKSHHARKTPEPSLHREEHGDA